MKRKRSGNEADYHCKHEIFLSHSGAQNGFSTDLYRSLSSLSYSVFLDQEHHSLPPGQDFPPLILSATKNCKVAIFVLSEEFVTSRWPMIELCAFADRLKASTAHAGDDVQSSTCSNYSAMPLHQLFLVPLFYKLSLQEIKREDKLEKWRKLWKEWEELDRRRMSADKCEEAVTKLLPRFNGVVRQSEQEQGEKSYIEAVVEAIFDILRPSNLYGAGDTNMYVGTERLCKVILDKFPKLEQHSSSSSQSGKSNAHLCILAMYGLPGSGKSTLCRLLRQSMLVEFRHNVLILELPTIFNLIATTDDTPLIKQQLTRLLSKFTPQIKNFASMDVKELYSVLGSHGICSHKMFLVFDNICPSNYESYKEMVLEILCSRIMGYGSKVMLVSRSHDVLEDLKKELDFKSGAPSHYKHAITEIPCLTEEEAIQLMRLQYSLDAAISVKEDLIADLLCQSSFRSSFMYIPMVFQLIGVFLRENDYTSVVEFCKLHMVHKVKKNAVQKLVGKIFEHLREDLRVLFMDIALFIIPAGFSESINDAVRILCKMHDTSEPVLFRMRIKELQKHCLLSISSQENRSTQQIQIHDIFMEYALSSHGNSKYINQIFDPLNSQSYMTTAVFPVVREQYLHGKNWLRSWLIWERRSRSHWRATCSEARTIIIEFPSNDFKDVPIAEREVSLDVEIGPKSQALLVRNQSRAPNSIMLSLSLSGDLSCLVFLKLESVHKLAISAQKNLSELVWFEWKNDDHNISTIRIGKASSNRQNCNQNRTSGWSGLISGRGYQMQCGLQHLMKWLLKKASLLPAMCWEQSHYNRFVSNMIASRWLTVLKLKNVGIQRIDLEDIGRCCPQLENLEIVDEAHELMSLSVGNAPTLRRLFIGPLYLTSRGKIETTEALYMYAHERNELAPKSSNLVLRLQECPQLQKLQVDVSLFDQIEVVGSVMLGSQNIDIHHDSTTMRLIASCNHHLLRLESLELSCTKVESLDFTSFCLPALKTMRLMYCTNLTHLIIGSGFLPKLVDLLVDNCAKLQAFEGLQNLVMEQLVNLTMIRLPQLQCRMTLYGHGSCLQNGALMHLPIENIFVTYCPGVIFSRNILAASKNIQGIVLVDACVGLAPGQSDANLLNAIMSRKDSLLRLRLRNVSLHYREDENVSISPSELEDSDGSTNIPLMSVQEDESDDKQAQKCQTRHCPNPLLSLHRWRFPESGFVCNLQIIELSIRSPPQLQLQEIDGIQHLHNLEQLWLSKLENLTCISGKWPARVESIGIDGCPKLQRIPPLKHTPQLRELLFDECIKLEAVEAEFHHMKKLEIVIFFKCESMAVFPMDDVMEVLRSRERSEDYMKRRNTATSDLYEPRLAVWESKFASVEVLQGWLRGAEFGSVLFEAALDGLMWEYACRKVRINQPLEWFC